MIDRLKKALEAGTPVTACWSTLRDPQLAGAFARGRYDAVILDMQHGFHGDESILAAIGTIIAAGKSPLVRIPVRRWDLAERALDYGALGIIAPMTNTGEDAKAFAQVTKYIPRGTRSYGPRYAAGLYDLSPADYQHSSQDSTLAFAMIETQEAYDNLDYILAVDQIDGVLVGPSDFSVSVRNETTPDPYGPDTIKLAEDIAKRTLAANKLPAAFAPNAKHANLVHGFGYRLIVVSIDESVIRNGSEADFEGLKFD